MNTPLINKPLWKRALFALRRLRGLRHTRAALRKRDSESLILWEFMHAETAERAGARISALALLDTRVREAFYKDCVEQGLPYSRDYCMRIEIEWLKQVAKPYSFWH